MSDVDKLAQANKLFKNNAKISENRMEAYCLDIKELKVKILNQQGAIDSYLVEIDLQRKEYADAKK